MQAYTTFTPHAIPILEYDAAPSAIIEPREILSRLEAMPPHVVLCYFREVIAVECAGQPVIGELSSEMGALPVYRLDTPAGPVAVMQGAVGAPLAGGFLEELIALGAQHVIAVGGAGVLRPELTVGHVILPTEAIRDEGTSYHYLPAGSPAQPAPRAVEAIRAVLTAHAVPYVEGATWTTDALYRETVARIARRREAGCLCVEMECAACCAIAGFRGIEFGQILYGGDDISGERWDARDWIRSQATTREKLFRLAVEACLRL
jgi:uridine phosphorylase